MNRCPRCGFANLDSRDTCLKCKAGLRHRDPLESRAVHPRRLDLAGGRLRLTRLWRTLTGWMRPTLPTDLPHRRPATAATLCLVPGLGQLYNRQPLKALWFVLAWVAAGALIPPTLFDDTLSTPAVIVFLAVWFWMANDALATAVHINGQVWTPRHAWAMYFALMAMVSFVWFAALFLFSPLAYFRLIGNDTFAPLIVKGDTIWLDKWSLAFGGVPRRGELVYYDPAPFIMHRGANAIFYDAGSFIERVIGLPGETVVVDCSGDEPTITVNGVPLPREIRPLSMEYLPNRREFHLADDEYLILQSMTMNEGLVGALSVPGVAPSLSGLDLDPERAWTQSCRVTRDQMIGRVWLIASPPSHRRWFSRPDPQWMPR